MKAILIILTFIFSFCIFSSNAIKLEKVWETKAELKTPESVLYDAESDVIYVANIDGNPLEKDGNGFISILNPDGSEKDLYWIKKLNAPKGMAIFDGKLYVSDIDQLVEIDIERGKILKKYEAAGAKFLNDVAVCMNGMIFVSDSETAKIYVLNHGEFKVWMAGEPFVSPNGLFTEKGKLYVGDTNIYEIDILTQKINSIIEDTGGVDGLEKNNDGDLVFSNWPGRIFINQNGQTSKLLDSTAEEINTADIDFASKYDLILVPTFYDNHVVAYKIIN
ncbi:hypothetical protein GM418_04890 [Maribellus comscasis]|uniref:Uncharacterized protein n=1 Tax=Maribellus comscasis TaxID=2681766 RepID=A0A6I6JSB4_9BACT|nr:hypothetical protein [Maribellus comscasis]QGY43017.1 hypothetical protein GM418_04890 [Maribellus comscasis]